MSLPREVRKTAIGTRAKLELVLEPTKHDSLGFQALAWERGSWKLQLPEKLPKPPLGNQQNRRFVKLDSSGNAERGINK
uniref:Uncharacterized protein n=1 Tax=Candidatus Kentrum sp. LFY TaxID=2126342 RepID=A0A450WXV8_9GAMM|nr:MAG: hypothetical protein BECKLFY1418C_GA0070996_11045 [Candidatus Kentron sp. LFY]